MEVLSITRKSHSVIIGIHVIVKDIVNTQPVRKIRFERFDNMCVINLREKGYQRRIYIVKPT